MLLFVFALVKATLHADMQGLKKKEALHTCAVRMQVIHRRNGVEVSRGGIQFLSVVICVCHFKRSLAKSHIIGLEVSNAHEDNNTGLAVPMVLVA